MRMLSIIALAAASLMLPACSATTMAAPENLLPAVADNTTADETIGLTVEIDFIAAAKGLTIAAKSGLIKGDDATKALAIKEDAFRGVCITRAAYDLANKRERSAEEKARCDHLLPDILPNFLSAEASAKALISQLLKLIP